MSQDQLIRTHWDSWRRRCRISRSVKTLTCSFRANNACVDAALYILCYSDAVKTEGQNKPNKPFLYGKIRSSCLLRCCLNEETCPECARIKARTTSNFYVRHCERIAEVICERRYIVDWLMDVEGRKLSLFSKLRRLLVLRTKHWCVWGST